jgi:dTDP-4-dehydrorhamnose reductase
MQRVLLLGGSGILGTAVLQKLIRENIKHVAPMSRDLDIRDKVSVQSFIQDLKPSWIVNCAAWTNVDKAEERYADALILNSLALNYISEAAILSESRVIHISTDYVFDGEKATPYLESDVTNPINAYGRSKLGGELHLQKNLERNSFVIRTSWLYGENGKNFAKTLARKALHGEVAKVVSDQFGSPTNSADLACGIVELIKNPTSPGIYHFSNLGEASWFEFAQEIYRIVGVESNLVSRCFTSDLKQETNRPKYSVLSKEKWQQSQIFDIPEWRKSLELTIPRIVEVLRNENSK